MKEVEVNVEKQNNKKRKVFITKRWVLFWLILFAAAAAVSVFAINVLENLPNYIVDWVSGADRPSLKTLEGAVQFRQAAHVEAWSRFAFKFIAVWSVSVPLLFLIYPRDRK